MNGFRWLWFPALAVVIGGATGLRAEPIDFNRDIRPLLSDKCFRCHGPDPEERQTDLRLDLKESALGQLASGDYAIVPGDTRRSQLVQRITAEDESVRMPPAESGKTLTPAEIQRLKRWIDQGASWSDHWAFVAPQRPVLPPVRDADWVRNPLDRFVLAQLERLGRRPAPEADRRTLLRRVTYELTGLPPTLDEIRAFQEDRSPNAYEKLVDRLLDSPHYGEHRARYWLDAARYGDTHGLHLDNERSIWPYRDWVIDAFNRNVPFDQFTIEQLAGDLLPGATLRQRVATGFNRCNVTTSEGGSIDEEYLVRYAVDRVETTSTVWIGLTAGCAVCHDHKFDPVSQEEFYGLFAYFFNLTERAMDGNALLPPPSVKTPTLVQQVRLNQLQKDLSEVTRQVEERRLAFADRLVDWVERSAVSDVQVAALPRPSLLCTFDEDAGSLVKGGDRTGSVIGTPLWDAGKRNAGLRLDGASHVDFGDAADFERSDRFSLGAWVYPTREGAMTIVSRMDDQQDYRGYDVYLGDGRVFVHLIHKWDDNAIRVNTRVKLSRNAWQQVFVTYDGSSQAAGITVYLDGAPQELEVTHDRLRDSIRTAASFRIGSRSSSAPFHGSIDEVRVYPQTLSPNEIKRLIDVDPVAEVMKIPPPAWTAKQREMLLDHFLSEEDASYRELKEREDQLQDQIRRLQGRQASTLVMQEMSQPRKSHILIRGQYDQKGAEVEPGVPAALPGLPADAPSNRLGLARWLVDRSNPLTARVTVNRFWQHAFGVGIVETAEDFGSQGAWPSHPDLLDWLAVEFMESGWDVKAIQRLIVTSATYRQSSASSRTDYMRDPKNRQLARGPRFRMDAEMIRDACLAHSGLLVNRIGGKSVKPYQPPGLWSAVGYTTSNTARFKQDHGDALYRRSLYTFWKRTSPPPSLQIFDAPSREVCVVRRPRTNTPAAALVLMNDIQFVEAARNFAESILRSPGNDEARIRLGFETVTARMPDAYELSVLSQLLIDNRVEFREDPDAATALVTFGESPHDQEIDTVELAAWTMLTSALFNLDEAVTKQ